MLFHLEYQQLYCNVLQDKIVHFRNETLPVTETSEPSTLLMRSMMLVLPLFTINV